MTDSDKSMMPGEARDLISVVIPCYNIRAQIGRSLDSVLAQDYEKLEILVIDDGSTDGSSEICAEYAARDPRIRVIRQDNAGPGPARNRGLKEIHGEIIAFVDGDDRILPGMFRRMLSAMKQSDAQMAVCRYRCVSERDLAEKAKAAIPDVEPVLPEGSTGGDRTAEEPEAGFPVRVMSGEEALRALVVEEDSCIIQNAVWNKMYRRELFDEGRMEGETLRFPAHRYEEIVVMAKLISLCERVAYIDEPLYEYIADREGSIMNSGRLKELLVEQIPSYWERDAFLNATGRHALAVMNDYIVGKKLLELHTIWKHQADRADLRELDNVIRTHFGPGFREIYACPVADPHHALRMRLYLLHPVFYDLFTAVNNALILPLKRVFRKG